MPENTEQSHDSLALLMSQGFSDTVLTRFWAKVRKTDTCWLWFGAKTLQGYGKLNTAGNKGRTEVAHRISWMIHRGPIPEGLSVLHNCPGGINELCVNPDHLFVAKGHPEGIKFKEPDIDRFARFIQLDEVSGCWLWTGAKNRRGYPKFSIGSRFKQAHRFAYEELIGPIPEDTEIHHKCRNPSCVNPYHLEPKAHADHCLEDFRKPFCEKGHPMTEGNYYEYFRNGRSHRQCRICSIEKSKANYRKRKAGLLNPETQP